MICRCSSRFQHGGDDHGCSSGHVARGVSRDLHALHGGRRRGPRRTAPRRAFCARLRLARHRRVRARRRGAEALRRRAARPDRRHRRRGCRVGARFHRRRGSERLRVGRSRPPRRAGGCELHRPARPDGRFRRRGRPRRLLRPRGGVRVDSGHDPGRAGVSRRSASGPSSCAGSVRRPRTSGS